MSGSKIMDKQPKRVSGNQIVAFYFLRMTHEYHLNVVPMLRHAISEQAERRHWPEVDYIRTFHAGWLRHLPEMLDEASALGICRLSIGSWRTLLDQPYVDSIIIQDEWHTDISHHHERFLTHWNTILHHTCQRCGAGGEYVRPRMTSNVILCPGCSAYTTSQFLITAMTKEAHKYPFVVLSSLAVIRPIIDIWMKQSYRDIIRGKGKNSDSDEFIISQDLLDFRHYYLYQIQGLCDRIEALSRRS